MYEQVGANWGGATPPAASCRSCVSAIAAISSAVQNAERNDPAAQQLIAEFCELINYPYQQQQQQFVVGFYASALPIAPLRGPHVDESAPAEGEEPAPAEGEAPATDAAAVPESEAFTETPSEEPLAENEPEATTHNELADASPVEHHESEPTEELAFESEESLADEPIAEEAAIASAQVSEDTATEDFFADDDNELTEHAEPEHQPAEPVADSHSALDQPASGEASPAADPHVPMDQDDLDLDEELDIGQDDISRLAEELAAGDAQLDDSRHPDPSGRHHPGRASGNGAH